MVSRAFNSYSEEEKRRIIKELLEVQDRKCLFCGKPINYSDDVTLDEFLKHHEVDHIKPLTEVLGMMIPIGQFYTRSATERKVQDRSFSLKEFISSKKIEKNLVKNSLWERY